MTVPLLVEDVSLRFGRIWALRHVQARFQEGTINAILGDNGAGKSSLLSICAGILRPTEGHVQIFGEKTKGFPPRHLRAHLAYMGHAPFVYQDLSGLENLSFFSKLYDKALDEDKLQQVGLQDAKNKLVAAYSRGMVQRLCLARLLVQDAPIWLLDEPTTGLDKTGIADFVRLIQAAKERGVTVVMVTHHLEVLGHVDQVVELSRGRLRELEGAHV